MHVPPSEITFLLIRVIGEQQSTEKELRAKDWEVDQGGASYQRTKSKEKGQKY